MSENTPPSTDCDTSRRFLFDDFHIRGELVRLEASLTTILGQHFYPEPVSELLGEMLAASALFASTLKFKGALSLQARSEGSIRLIFAECLDQRQLRGYAVINEQAMAEGVDRLLDGGLLAITISPDQGQQYQGVVPLDSSVLANCLEHYFEQSEQLSTALLLACDGKRAAGMLLQALPAQDEQASVHVDNWTHVTHLMSTLSRDELLGLPFETLLYRLFHQDQVRLFEPRELEFGCKCSIDRVNNAIRATGEAEARSIIEEQGLITVHCEFCQQEYQLNEAVVDQLFPPKSDNTLH
jgi:molecular chaperone Hsp33